MNSPEIPPSNAAPVAVRSSDGGRQELESDYINGAHGFEDVVERDFARKMERRLKDALAAAQERVVELEIKIETYLKDTSLNQKLDAALAEAARFKTERDGALHSSESWELLHAKRHKELEVALAEVSELKKERDESQRSFETILRSVRQSANDHQRNSIQKDITIAALRAELAGGLE